MNDHNLEQVVKIPTRNENTLDLFYLNQPSLVHNTKTLPPLGNSDHDIVFHEMCIEMGRRHKTPRTVIQYKKADWEKIKSEINQYKESYFETTQNCTVEKKWQHIKSEIDNIISKHIPTKQTKTKQDLPWLNAEIKRTIRKRDKKYRQYRKEKSEKKQNTLNQYKSLKRQVQKQLRNAYWSYVESIIVTDSKDAENSGKPSKKLWSFIKHQKSENTGVSPLKVNGITHTKPTEQAEALNKQFHSAFTTPKPMKLSHITEYNILMSKNHPEHQMEDIIITSEGVDKLLKNLNPSKAIGPDKISPHFLKETHSELAPIIADLITTSIDTGSVPSDWRQATVTPVFKKGAKCKPENYRPISLTCILSKLTEHIFVSNIIKHLDKHNLLYEFQHGFRSKLSCETQLVTFIQEITDKMAEGKQTDVAVMDFSKAFDKVDHQRLLLKLKRLGINNKTVNWIKSFLSNRQQKVVVDGQESGNCPVLSGVPQGSVLGPCLFLIYINDMPNTLASKTRLFADDTIVYFTINSQTDCSTLQSDLNKLQKWEDEWLMSFNPDKCEIIHISRKKKPIKFEYTLHNKILKSADKVKYLGLTITKDLTWNNHINNITNKANNTLRFVKRNIKTNNIKTKELAYKTYVRPQLEYCNIVWDPWQQTYIHKIEMIQRRAARYTLNKYSYQDSVTIMLQQLNWPSLQQRRQFSALTMLYKIKNHLVNVNCQTYLIPSRDHKFQLPYSPTNYHSSSFFPRTIRMWNSLPSIVALSPDLTSFKSGLQPIIYN